MLFLFKDYTYSYQALRALTATVVEAADIGECLAVCKNIQENNDESWFEAWNAMATKVDGEGTLSEKRGHQESARTAFMRASTYFRTAEFFLHTNPSDPRIVQTARKSRSCFEKALRFFPHPVHKVHIPFEQTTLPAYLCLANQDPTPRPLLIIQTGFDGTKEEIYSVGQAAVKRGYHVLLFEGPGQGEVIREQSIPFRPNWESVITPVIDYVYSLQMVDKEKISLLGISMGGYLVPRALAFEKRVKIGIANGGVYDFHEVCSKDVSPEEKKLLDTPEGAKNFDDECKKIMEISPSFRWGISHGMYVFQAKSPSEWLKMTRDYTLHAVADKIECKMLVVDAEEDEQMKGQAEKLLNALTCPKDSIKFRADRGAGLHCQVGAYSVSNEKILNWLDENL